MSSFVNAVGSPALLLFIGSALLAFVVALVATPVVGAFARRVGLLDQPGGRRQHPRPIPRIGGLGIAVAFGVTILAFWLVDRFNGHPFLIPEEVRSPRFTLTMMAAILGLAVGILDDALDLRARWQLLGYVAIAGIIVAAGIRIDFINDPRGDGLITLAMPLSVGFTVFWIVGMHNALNFIDGLDGLAAGVAGIAAVALGATALLPAVNEPFVAWMNFTLAGAIGGFLVFNFHPAKVFLGTTGVAFLGTMLAVLSIFGTAKVAAALLVLGVPIIDTFYVIIRRLVTGQAPFAPDRGHFHHKLLDVGLSHRQAVLLIYAITLGLGALAFVSSGRAQLYSFVGLLVLFGVAVLALSQRSAKATDLDPNFYPEKAE
jgi:UDP-GlcNAc:undecaprenyl-phosphate GlcNAc-1-phosphate transferase